MAEKDQYNYPLAPNSVLRSDAETRRPTWNQTDPEQEIRKKKKRQRRLISTATFMVFLTAVIIFFILAITRAKTPEVRFNMVTVDNIVTSNSSSARPMFSMRLVGEIKVKNTNFGHFKFGDSVGTVAYEGVDVGEFIIQEREIRSRSSKKIRVMADLDSRDVPDGVGLGSEIGSGVLMLSSEANLKGKVQFLKVIKRRKSAELSCIMRINLSAHEVQDLKCK